ncbi:hypothetical protein GDO81_006868 [Engystomops pustulosus]|uniref:Uncharacterized protein n=1 Tax=Engystomops pustulosus TaxID=76066 RepID=A0AAV7CZY9_ENGPU|nr:hypothetical protein GDO81_006868 [Engystomops pustulosus]
MEDTERRLSAGTSFKTPMSDQDALNLLQEFAEQKRREREKDPEVKRMKNKYKLRAAEYPSPGNILHTGKQLPRSPAPGVLPLLPSQQFEPGTNEDEESFSSRIVTDNIVPCGRQLERTPVSGHVLGGSQVNGGTITREGDENSPIICDTAEEEIIIRKICDENRNVHEMSNTAGLEHPSCGNGMKTVPKTMDTERRLSAWRRSKTAMSDQDALNFLQEFAEQKRKDREKDPEVKRMKNKYKLRAAKYPSPGNVLHTGKQLLRSPAPGVLPLLPSQQFEPRRDEDEESFSSRIVTDNIVPCGRQLERTPVSGHVLGGIQVNGGTNTSEENENSPIICDEMTRSKVQKENSEVYEISSTAPDLHNTSGGDGTMAAQKEVRGEDPTDFSRPTMQNNRRISEMPVQGLNQMRISGVLKKMAGYECRNEDLEFLRHMENQEKAKVLKKELLSLRKDLAATKQEKELVLAKKEKIEDDIEKMKFSFERAVRLGRSLLSRTRDPTIVSDLSPDDVLKQLNSVTIHTVQQQTRLQLAAAEKELARRQREAADRTSLAENQRRSLTLKLESSEQHVKEVQCRIQMLKEEAIALKTQIEQTEERKSKLEENVQKKRQQMSYCPKHTKQNTEMSEEEREKLNRRLQRILHRKDNYLERERILQRLQKDLQ